MANPFDIANFNLTNFAQILPDVLDSEPKTVEYVFKDQNGNLQTKNIENRGLFKKHIWDDVNSALSLMSRTYYVDQVNGSDINDGSSGSPFKTLKKAIDSVPYGGKGTIILLGENYNLTEDITIINKYIYISGSHMTGENIIYNDSYIDNYGNATYGFILRNSILEMFRLTIRTADFADTSQGHSYYEGFIKRYGSFASNIRLNGCSILLGDTPFARIDFNTPSGFDIQMRYRNNYGENPQPYSITCVGANGNGKFLHIEAGTARLGLSGVNLGKKIDGSSLSWSDLVAGIVKDADGKPRNILSNIVL